MSEFQANEENTRDARIGRILNDYLDRRAQGEAESEAEFLAKHPNLQEHLRPHLEMLRDLTPSSDKIESLIKQGVLQSSTDPKYAAVLGPYKITGWIGRGGMGLVLEAYEESLNRTVALKILRPELAEDETALARFTREAKTAATLRHPNIITVHAVGQEHNAHFVAMEYVNGGTLAQLIQREGCLPAETIRRLFGEILSGLAAAHEADLIHRDIKPSNILLDRDSSIVNRQSAIVKIADFGLARMLSSKTRMTTTGSILGTPEYMSPEQARGQTDIDHRTDLYSAGVVLYEMLTSRTPFKADTPSATIHRILNEQPAHPKNLGNPADANLASLALRLLAKNRSNRVETAGQAQRLLDAHQVVKLPELRRQLAARLGIAALAALLLAGAFWLMSLGPSEKADNAARILAVDWGKVQGVDAHLLYVEREHVAGRELLHEFDESNKIMQAVLADSADQQGRIVVVGLMNAIDGDGKVVMAFDDRGEELWHASLHADYDWPDCESKHRHWNASRVAAGDLDGRPGDEIVVAGGHPKEYPARVSIINPASGIVETTFWNWGHITDMQILSDFFGNGQGAILVIAHNHKLDGFNDLLKPDERQLSDWDEVMAMSILDPRTMGGIGPPHADRIPNGPPHALPHAYAFLNAPLKPECRRVSYDATTGARTTSPRVSQPVCTIDLIESASDEGLPGDPPWFQVELAAADEPEGEKRVGYVFVDRNLRLVGESVVSDTSHPPPLSFWQARWERIVANGRDLPEENRPIVP